MTRPRVNANTPSYVALPWVQAARYAEITVTTGDGSPACVGEIRLFGEHQATDEMMLGADLSFTQQEEAAGTRFTDAGKRSDPVRILRAHGGNYVRMRLWLNPPPEYSDLTNGLELARRAKAAGMKVYLDIHYSDFWADPQHQDIPAAWQGQDLEALTETVRTYTRDVIAAFARQRTPVDMVSIGNEIRNGMLWPIGQINWTANTGWDNLATLLRAGVEGAQSANPRGHELRVMMHFDQGGNNPDSTTFFTNLIDRGVQFDVIGLSYYTFFHGPVASLRDNVDKLATQFDKDIVIAEAQSAWTLANGDTTGNFVWQTSQVEAGYPATPGGQLSLNNDLLSILAHAPNGRGRGTVLLVTGVGARRRLGTRGRNSERQPHPLRLPGPGPAIDRNVRESHGGLPALRPLRRPVRRTRLIGVTWHHIVLAPGRSWTERWDGWGICCCGTSGRGPANLAAARSTSGFATAASPVARRRRMCQWPRAGVECCCRRSPMPTLTSTRRASAYRSAPTPPSRGSPG